MSGPVFYSQKQLLPKIWQRYVYAGIVIPVTLAIGVYYQNLSNQRYSAFRGKTSLYGAERFNRGKFIEK